MTFTEKEKQEFEAVTRPIIEWLNAHCHPHVVVLVETDRATLYEGEISYVTYDYIKG